MNNSSPYVRRPKALSCGGLFGKFYLNLFINTPSSNLVKIIFLNAINSISEKLRGGKWDMGIGGNGRVFIYWYMPILSICFLTRHRTTCQQLVMNIACCGSGSILNWCLFLDLRKSMYLGINISTHAKKHLFWSWLVHGWVYIITYGWSPTV